MLEQLLMSLKVMVLGFGTVFIALILLIGVIQLINKLISTNFSAEADNINESPSNMEVIDSIENTGEIDDEELIAVITAAIAASLNRSTHDIIVKSIKRIPYRVPAWNQVSRSQQIATRL